MNPKIEKCLEKIKKRLAETKKWLAKTTTKCLEKIKKWIPETKKWLKEHLNLCNIIIGVCIIIILMSLFIIIKPKEEKDKSKTVNEINVNSSSVKEETQKNPQKETKEAITEEDARKKALDKLKEIGEQNIQESDLEISKIERNGEEYYYIESPDNTLEIKISSGEIKRLNSIVVE